MAATQEIERYLNLFRLRLKQLTAARGLAMMSVAAALITVVAVVLAVRSGFPDDLIIAARILLILSLVTLALRFIVIPNRRIERSGAAEIEARTPAFGGRVDTYTGMTDANHPLRDLLAEDSLQIARQYPVEQQIPQREFSLVLSIATVFLAGLLILAIAGPGNYAYGVRHLWVGWIVADLLPPQSIEVTPGNDGIRMGGTVRVHAAMHGFAPGRAYVHASFGDGDWQQVEMAAADDEFEFAFFSVREPLHYYVSAANVRSETYRVEVVDVPGIENLVLTYRYPAWANREAEVHDPGGDVRAIGGTEVEVAVRSDGPMPPAVLVIDDVPIRLAVSGDAGAGTFTVQEDGQYYIAATVGGEQIRLSDDYFITLLDDESPEIEFSRPGRDWSASSIEEVTVGLSAQDDFALESLELRYSVNGGDWQSAELPVDGNEAEVEHVFFLESLAEDDNDAQALVPGDLIAYYATATDRGNSSRTDIFFIDVQPFDRRYSQSQQSAGGGQQGARQDEISQRQREIIVSTWNLIREQSNKRRADVDYVPDNAALLSRVQATLKEQAQTLAERTRARQLVASDEQITVFVDNLIKAAAAMVPAVERLAEADLEQAILPEQEALQHLLRAEAAFTDISVSLQANNRGGGGGRAGRDLTDMFELEMDLEKNQYETGSSASPDSTELQLDQAQEALSELARRQQQLAENLNRDRLPTPAQRWQQEMLRRDLEELRERLERMQQAAAANQQQAAGQSTQGSSGQSPDSEQEQRRSDELQRRLDSAMRAMNEVDEAMREGADTGQLQRASAEAQRQLERARDRALEEQRQAAKRSLADLAARAGNLHDRQAELEQQLQDAIRDVLVGRNELHRLDSGMSLQQELEMAEEKRQLQADLQTLEQDVRQTARRLRDHEPRASVQLDEAMRKLREMEVEARLAVAAAYIEQGEAVYVAGSESAITDALRELREDLRRAESMSGTAAGERGDGEQGGLSQALAEAQQLRRELQRFAEGNANEGMPANRGRDDLQRSSGVRVADIDSQREMDRSLDNISDDVIALFRGMRAQGVAEKEIDELRRLAREIRAADFSGNEDILARESQLTLSLVEQLELALRNAAGAGNASVRANALDDIPQAHREVVADYYRRLGQSDRATTDEQH